MDLNPAHVRTLREIARHGSFSRAAESLRLSQPAVSLHMRQLEARCGTALLERVGKRAFPTPAGTLLLEHAGRAFAELEAAQEALRQLRGVVAGRLRLGTGATASIHLLPPLLRRMRARYPELELIVVTGNAPEIAAAVAANELDVGLVTLPVTGRQLLVTPLLLDPLVAVGPPAQGWPGRGALTAAELARHPLIVYERGGTIRRVIDGWFRRGGVRPRIVMELGNEEAIKKLVGAGLGVSVSPAMAVWASCAGATSRKLQRSACSWRPSKGCPGAVAWRGAALAVGAAAEGEATDQMTSAKRAEPSGSVKIVGRDARQPVAQRGEPLGPYRGDIVLTL
jgi:DNA-binding transcriptional LysR family regulator